MQTVAQVVTRAATHAIATIAPTTTVREGLQALAEHDYGALPVVQNGQLVGIFSERDYARKVVLQDRSSETTTVADVMSSDPVCLTPDQTIHDAMRIMTAAGFRHLPVVQDGALIGMLSMQDAVQTLLDASHVALEFALHAGKQKHEDFRRLKELTLDKVLSMNRIYLRPLRESLQKLTHGDTATVQQAVTEMLAELDDLLEVLDHLSHWYRSERSMESKHVLLAEHNLREQVLAKMALGGSGAVLDQVETIAEGIEAISRRDYDILCVNEELAELADAVHERSPATQVVLLSSGGMQSCLPILRQHGALANIASRNPDDRTFTVRSILTTVSKLASRDIFGLEKYLNWGADVRQSQVEHSGQRRQLRDGMAEHFRALGLRRTVVDRAVAVADELLLNAIYDAPRDADGTPRYDHLDRTDSVALDHSEEAVFRYGCDGTLAALSVTDPFGAIDRDTALSYLENCYQHSPAELNDRHAGFGRGLYISMETSDLVVFNVHPRVRTEVVALFTVDLAARRKIKTSSFHYFSV